MAKNWASLGLSLAERSIIWWCKYDRLLCFHESGTRYAGSETQTLLDILTGFPCQFFITRIRSVPRFKVLSAVDFCKILLSHSELSFEPFFHRHILDEHGPPQSWSEGVTVTHSPAVVQPMLLHSERYNTSFSAIYRCLVERHNFRPEELDAS